MEDVIPGQRVTATISRKEFMDWIKKKADIPAGVTWDDLEVDLVLDEEQKVSHIHVVYELDPDPNQLTLFTGE